jgi:hypothetical protein
MRKEGERRTKAVVPVAGGEEEGRAAVFKGGVDLGAVLHQHVEHFFVATAGRVHQARPAWNRAQCLRKERKRAKNEKDVRTARGCGVDIGARLEDESSSNLVLVRHCVQERTKPVPVLLGKRSPGVQQHLTTTNRSPIR